LPEFIEQNDEELKNNLSLTDSRDLISYIKKLDQRQRKIFFKRLKNILGKEYIKMIKLGINI
jgi:hypothetical protein